MRLGKANKAIGIQQYSTILSALSNWTVQACPSGTVARGSNKYGALLIARSGAALSMDGKVVKGAFRSRGMSNRLAMTCMCAL